MASTIAQSLFDKLADALSSQQSASAISQMLVAANVPESLADIIGQAVTGKVQVALPDNASLNLQQVLQPFLPQGISLPTPFQQVTVTALTFSADTSGTFSFSGKANLPLSLLGGSQTLDASLSFTSKVTNGTRAAPTGSLSGSITISSSAGNAAINGSYDLTSEEQDVALSFTDTSSTGLTIDDVFKLFGQSAPTLPSEISSIGVTEFDFSLAVSDSATNLNTTLNTTSGEAILDIQHSQQATNVLLGIELAPSLASIPIIGPDLSQLNFTVSGALLLVSNSNRDNYTVPSASGSTNPFANYKLNVKTGVFAAAVLDFANSSGNQAGYVTKLLNKQSNTSGSAALGDALLTAEITENSMELTVKLQPLQLPIGNGANAGTIDLDCSLDIGVNGSSPYVRLSGDLVVAKLNNTQFTAAISITDEEVSGSLDAAAGEPFELEALPGVYLSELGGMLGFDFDKDEVTAGFVAKFSLGSAATPSGSTPDANSLTAIMPSSQNAADNKTLPSPPDNEVALVLGFNVEADVPDVDLIILQLANINLADVATTLVDLSDPNGVNTAFKGITIKDALLYWCDDVPGGLMLPDGSQPATGFRLHGGINFFDKFGAWGRVELITTGSNLNCSGDAYISPVNIANVLSLTGDDSAMPDAQEAQQAGVTLGGPAISVSTNGPDYLDATWNAKLFGTALDTSGDIQISATEFVFTLDTSADNSAFAEALSITMPTDMTSLTTSGSLGLDGNITLPDFMGVSGISLAIDSSIQLNIAAGSSGLTVSGDFQFNDADLSLPSTTITDVVSDIKDLPNTILKAIEDNAETVFSHILSGAEQLISKYGQDALHEIEEIGEDIRNAVKWLLGEHHSKSDKAAWLKNGAMVRSSDGSCYGIRHCRRRLIPNDFTFTAMGGTAALALDAMAEGDSSEQQVANEALVKSIPIDGIDMPSLIDGTVLDWQTMKYHSDGTLKKEGSTGDLSIIIADSGTPARYDFHDYQTFILTLTKMGIQPTFMTADKEDVKDIKQNSQLSKLCIIGNNTATMQYLFTDGIVRHIPDTTTWSYFESGLHNPSNTFSDATIAAIPNGNQLPSLPNPGVVCCASTTMADGSTCDACTHDGAIAYYYAEVHNGNSKLHRLKKTDGITMSNVVRIAPDFMNILTTDGDAMDKVPT